ncbi:MAG: hypothetical protein ACM3WV_09550 [Bacillota bacterium]
MTEYYTYYPLSKQYVYEKEKNGKTVEKKILKTEESIDIAGVTDSGGGLVNADVYLIIDKDKHIGGEKGNRYYLTSTFYAGFIDKNDELQIADQTVTVDLEFER